MDIEVTSTQKTEDGWKFAVTVDSSHFTVTLDTSYWKKITDEEIDPKELIIQSFEFLLEREPVSAILSEFNLETIQRYFPEYEEKIME